MSIQIGNRQVSSTTSERIVLRSAFSNLIHMTSDTPNAYINFRTSGISSGSSGYHLGMTSNTFELLYDTKPQLQISKTGAIYSSNLTLTGAIITRSMTTSNASVTFGSDAANNFRILSGSNAVFQQTAASTYIGTSVGLGISSPSERLHVADNARVGNTLYAGSVMTSTLQGAPPNTAKIKFVGPKSIEFEGDLDLNGTFEFRSNVSLQEIFVQSTLHANRIEAIPLNNISTACNIIDVKYTCSNSNQLSPVFNVNSYGVGIGTTSATACVTIDTTCSTRSNVCILKANFGSSSPIIIDQDAKVGIGTQYVKHPFEVHITPGIFTETSNLTVSVDSNIYMDSLPLNLVPSLGTIVTSNLVSISDSNLIYDINVERIVPSPCNSAIGLYQHGTSVQGYTSYIIAYSNDIPVMDFASNATLYIGDPVRETLADLGPYGIHTAKPICTGTLLAKKIISPDSNPVDFTNLHASYADIDSLTLDTLNGSNIVASNLNALNLVIDGVSAKDGTFEVVLPQFKFTGTRMTIAPNLTFPLSNDGILRIGTISQYGGSRENSNVAVSIQSTPNADTGIRINGADGRRAYMLFSVPTTVSGAVTGTVANPGLVGMDQNGHMALSFLQDDAIKKIRVINTGVSIGNGIFVNTSGNSHNVGINYSQGDVISGLGSVPQYPLHVRGRMYVESLNAAPVFDVATSATGIARVGVGIPPNVLTESDYNFQVNGNIFASTDIIGNRFGIFNSNIIVGGDARITGNIYGNKSILTASDRDLKTNICPITDCLSKVCKMNGYTFHMKSDPTGPMMTGVIAQEVKEVLPEAVFTQPDGHLSVAYGNMAGLFIEAFKEMRNEIESLHTRMRELESQLQLQLQLSPPPPHSTGS